MRQNSSSDCVAFHFILVIFSYDLPLEIIHSDFKSGLEDLLKKKPTKAILLGTRIGDPNAVMNRCLVFIIRQRV